MSDKPPQGLSAPAADAPLRVLVVDDDESLRELIQLQIEQWHPCTVDTAESGQEAWGRLKTLIYDLVILDWKMPGVGGLVLFNRLRSLPHYELAPIMVCSGLLGAADFRLLEEYPCTRSVSKPFAAETFDEAATSLLTEWTWYRTHGAKVRETLAGIVTNQAGTMKDLWTLLKSSKNPVPIAVIAAEALSKHGDLTNAELVLNTIMKRTGRSPIMLFKLGRVLLQARRPEEALKILAEAQQQSPKNLSRVRLMGEIELTRCAPAEAASFFRAALTIDPEDAKAKTGLDLTTLVAAAPNAVDGGGRVDKSFAGIINVTAIALVREKKFAEGIRRYEEALEFLPDTYDQARISFNVGLAFEKWKKPDDAKKWFAKADKLAGGRFEKARQRSGVPMFEEPPPKAPSAKKVTPVQPRAPQAAPKAPIPVVTSTPARAKPAAPVAAPAAPRAAPTAAVGVAGAPSAAPTAAVGVAGAPPAAPAAAVGTPAAARTAPSAPTVPSPVAAPTAPRAAPATPPAAAPPAPAAVPAAAATPAPAARPPAPVRPPISEDEERILLPPGQDPTKLVKTVREAIEARRAEDEELAKASTDLGRHRIILYHPESNGWSRASRQLMLMECKSVTGSNDLEETLNLLANEGGSLLLAWYGGGDDKGALTLVERLLETGLSNRIGVLIHCGGEKHLIEFMTKGKTLLVDKATVVNWNRAKFEEDFKTVLASVKSKETPLSLLNTLRQSAAQGILPTMPPANAALFKAREVFGKLPASCWIDCLEAELGAAATDLSHARGQATQAAAKWPDLFAARLVTARLETLAGQADAPLNLLRWVETGRRSPGRLTQVGDLLALAQRPVELRELLEAWSNDQTPLDYRYHLLAGRLFLLEGKPDLALRCLGKVAVERPAFRVGLRACAAALEARSCFAQAAAMAELAIQGVSGNHTAERLLIARCFAKDRKWKDAEAYLVRWLTESPGHPAALAAQAKVASRAVP